MSAPSGGGVTADVGGNEAVFDLPQQMVSEDRLRIGHVKTGSTNILGLQTRDEGVDNDRPAGDVDGG